MLFRAMSFSSAVLNWIECSSRTCPVGRGVQTYVALSKQGRPELRVYQPLPEARGWAQFRASLNAVARPSSRLILADWLAGRAETEWTLD